MYRHMHGILKVHHKAYKYCFVPSDRRDQINEVLNYAEDACMHEYD